MEWLGYRKVAIKKLVLPGNYLKVRESAEVEQRARSIQALGVLQLPIVRWRDRLVICGTRRIAACDRLGMAQVEVRAIECTDDEARLMTAAENWEREHSPEKALKALPELVDLYEERVKQLGSFPEDRHATGRPLSERGKAQRLVAAATGKSIEQVRQADRRERLRQERDRLEAELKASEDQEPPVVSPVEMLGLTPDREWAEDLALVVATLKNASSYLVMAQGQMTKLIEAKRELSELKMARVRALAHEAAAIVKGLIPEIICPYCKALNPQCGVCLGLGAVPEGTAIDGPRELLHADKAMLDGNIVDIRVLAEAMTRE